MFCENQHNKSRNVLEGVSKFPFRISELILRFGKLGMRSDYSFLKD
jgi:hypothetical protein